MKDSDLQEAITEAITKAGGPAVLARSLGITTQAVCQWHRCPAERASDIERLSGVPREKLRPDIFQPQEARQ